MLKKHKAMKCADEREGRFASGLAANALRLVGANSTLRQFVLQTAKCVTLRLLFPKSFRGYFLEVFLWCIIIWFFRWAVYFVAGA